MKTCSKCQCEKSLEDFYIRKDRKDGHAGYCKACHKISHAKYYKANAEHVKAKASEFKKNNPDKYKTYTKINHLRTTYGITPEDLVTLQTEQNHRCKCCGVQSNKLHIDHCHKTGKIRGLLCQKCNMGIGLFNDNPELLIKASNYLKAS